MSFEQQIKNVEIIVNKNPRTYLKWENTEIGRDRFECYERINLQGTIVYVNAHNKSMSVTKGNPFFNILEDLFQKV